MYLSPAMSYGRICRRATSRSPIGRDGDHRLIDQELERDGDTFSSTRQGFCAGTAEMLIDGTGQRRTARSVIDECLQFLSSGRLGTARTAPSLR
jgi:hypothetical protein